MRVDDGRQGSGLLAPKMKARTVVGRGRRADPGHELRLGTEKESEKCEDNRWDGQKQEEKTPDIVLLPSHELERVRGVRSLSYLLSYVVQARDH